MWVLPHLAELTALEFKHLIRTPGWNSCFKWLDGKGVWEREKSKKQFVLIMKTSAFLHWPHSGIKDKDSLFRRDVELPETLNPALLSSLCSTKLYWKSFQTKENPIPHPNFPTHRDKFHQRTDDSSKSECKGKLWVYQDRGHFQRQ